MNQRTRLKRQQALGRARYTAKMRDAVTALPLIIKIAVRGANELSNSLRRVADAARKLNEALISQSYKAQHH